MKMDTSAANLRLLFLLTIASALLCGCGSSKQQIQADIRLVRSDIITLSNAAAARDPVAVWRAIENKVAMGANWNRAQGEAENYLGWASLPAFKEYYDAEHLADQIIGSMTKEEWGRTGQNSDYIEAFSGNSLSSEARLVLYQRIGSDCARALAKLPQ